VVACLVDGATAQSAPSSARQGVDVAPVAGTPTLPARKIKGSSGETIDVTILTVGAASAQLSLLYVPERVSGLASGQSVSLRELARTDAFAARSEHRRALVNGGLSSSREDVPLGLLVVDGRTISRLSESPAKPVEGCPLSKANRLRWSGLLCQAPNGGWSVGRADAYQPGSCTNALQSGPLLVADASNEICSSEPSRRRAADRLVACSRKSGDLVFVHADNAHLFPLAEWMATPVDKGGLGCDFAMNLSGANSAGIVYAEPGKPAPLFVGDGSFPLATALMIRWNDTSALAQQRRAAVAPQSVAAKKR
jgi:uncharacterized protein YigE (DUF2233 family)